MKIINYFGITLNVNDASYRQYHKPERDICYMHKKLNHPQQPYQPKNYLSK